MSHSTHRVTTQGEIADGDRLNGPDEACGH